MQFNFNFDDYNTIPSMVDKYFGSRKLESTGDYDPRKRWLITLITRNVININQYYNNANILVWPI